MGYRPADWQPLAGSDPVPGRPDDIRTEAGRLTRVADSIHDQVNALRRVAQADQDKDLQGQYAGSIAGPARDLADHLGKAENRYRVTAGELSAWADELQAAQSASYNQWQDAQQAQKDITANTPHPASGGSTAPAGSSGSSGGHPAPAVPDPAQQQRLKDAQERLTAAQAALAKTVGTLQDQGRAHAGAIRNVIKHDGLKDSWWDSFKECIDANSHWITLACNALGWLATACAVISLFIPGLNFVAAIALGATFFSLLGHTVLASAGDGSWFDVGLDAFALATMGIGGLAAESAQAGEKGLAATLKGEGALREGTRAFDDVVRADPELAAAYKAVDNPALSTAEKADNWLKISKGYPAASAARSTARQTVVDMAEHEPDLSKFTVTRSSLLFGDHYAVAGRTWAKGVAATMSHEPEIASRAARLYSNLGTVGWTWRLGTAADVVDKTMGSVVPWHTFHSPYPGWQGYYNTTRNPFYAPIGGKW
jgi:hypothetical protein